MLIPTSKKSWLKTGDKRSDRGLSLVSTASGGGSGQFADLSSSRIADLKGADSTYWPLTRINAP